MEHLESKFILSNRGYYKVIVFLIVYRYLLYLEEKQIVGKLTSFGTTVNEAVYFSKH